MIRLCLQAGLLARVKAVGAGNDLQQQGYIGHAAGHRTGVVDRDVDGEDAGVGHQAVGRFQAADAAPRARNPNRAALVAAERHIDLAGRHQRAAAARRAAGGPARVVGIANRAGVAAMTAARGAQVLAHRLAADRAAGVEDAADDRGVNIGHIALQHAAAVHHRHSGQADVVLERNRPAGQRTRRGAFDFGPPVPGAQGIVLGLGTMAGRTRIGHRQAGDGELIQAGVRGQHAVHQALEGFQVVFGQVQGVAVGHIGQLIQAWSLEAHVVPPLFSIRAATRGWPSDCRSVFSVQPRIIARSEPGCV